MNCLFSYIASVAPCRCWLKWGTREAIPVFDMVIVISSSKPARLRSELVSERSACKAVFEVLPVTFEHRAPRTLPVRGAREN